MISDDYKAQLELEHAGDSKWGSTAWRYGGGDIVTLIEERPYIKTVLDFGSGKGTMGDYVQPKAGRQLTWVNYDPGIAGIDKMPAGEFDMVITCDVLEHVEPDDIHDTIIQLANLTGKLMYNNIACYPTGKLFSSGPYAGQDLHLIQEQPDWWRESFARWLPEEFGEFEYRHIERLRKGTQRPRCVLIHERIG